MTVTIRPVVTKDVLLRLSAAGATTSESSWRRLRREQFVTGGVRRQDTTGRSSRTQAYSSLNGLAILLADHAHDDARARTVRIEAEKLEQRLAAGAAIERISTRLERLWKKFLPKDVHELRGLVLSVANDRAVVRADGDNLNLLLPTEHGFTVGDAVIVLQIPGDTGRWTTCVLPGDTDVTDDDEEFDAEMEYRAHYAPDSDVQAEIERLVDAAREGDKPPVPIALTLL